MGLGLNVCLAILLLASAALAQQFEVKPAGGESCTHYDLYVRRTDQTWTMPCPQGLVVNSSGICGPRSESDRCQYSSDLTPAYLANRCRQFPQMVFADPTNCSRYYNCQWNNAIQPATCPFGQLYDDAQKLCRDVRFVLCGTRTVRYTGNDVERICRMHPQRVMPGPECNNFYNCSRARDPWDVLPPYHGECNYLELFDHDTKTCRPYDQVDCLDRREIKNPCDLRRMQCSRSAHCRPCHIDHADCSNLPDGKNQFPGQPYTPRYVHCHQGRSLGTRYCQAAAVNVPRLFDPRKNDCNSVYAIPRSLGGWGAEA